MSYIHKITSQKNFELHDYIVLDGIDGIGKTTQINLLQNYLEKNGYTVFRTRSLGGTIGSECDKLRHFIIENSFSKETEEVLLASAAWLNIKEIIDTINKYNYRNKKKLVILQDRGILSHLAYSQSRGFARTESLEIHHKNIQAAGLLRAKNIVLMPLNIDVILQRIKARGDIGHFHEKYEKEDFQLKVLNRMVIELQRKGEHGIKSLGDFSIVKIKSEDEPLDVHEQVLKCLNLK